MPGQALRDRAFAKMEQGDYKWEPGWQLQLMSSLRIQQVRDAMRSKTQLPGNRQ